jgi:hypothetical protein
MYFASKKQEKKNIMLLCTPSGSTTKCNFVRNFAFLVQKNTFLDRQNAI